MRCRFRKQVTETEEGPLRFRRHKGKANMPGGRPGGREDAEGSREQEQHRALGLEVLGRIPTEYSSAFQVSL